MRILGTFFVFGILVSCAAAKEPEKKLVVQKLEVAPIQEPEKMHCGKNEIYISGEYCPEVNQVCKKWEDPDANPKLRCLEFSKSECVSKQRKHLEFCIDKYEWPNSEGEIPVIDINWYNAQKKCEEAGKRLCTANEWTFACEGPDSMPYPYGDGMHRDTSVCDQQHNSMNPNLPRSEWPKYNHEHASGSAESCKTYFGVYDMVANVDEWVLNEGGKKDGDPYFSGMKGGYWTYAVRTRCRPMTTVHGPTHQLYQQGFRCCNSAN